MAIGYSILRTEYGVFSCLRYTWATYAKIGAQPSARSMEYPVTLGTQLLIGLTLSTAFLVAPGKAEPNQVRNRVRLKHVLMLVALNSFHPKHVHGTVSNCQDHKEQKCLLHCKRAPVASQNGSYISLEMQLNSKTLM